VVHPEPPPGAAQGPLEPIADYNARLRARIAAAGPPAGSPEPQDADARLRARIAAETFQLRSGRLRAALDEVAAVKTDLRALAAEMGPRLQALEARLVVLSRTVGHMLAELDQTHATTVVALRRGDTPPRGASLLADPNAPTPRPGA
jgi:hypothetical protein